jgi:hypothetical protein
MPPMKQQIWISIVIALALAACGKKGDDAAKGSAAGGAGGAGGAGAAGAADASACAAAAAAAVASLPAGMEAAGVKEKLAAIYTTRCTEDKWAADVIQCYAKAAGMPGLQACRAKLPPDLGTKLRGEIMAAMAGAAAGMGGRPPMGHPGGDGSGAAAPPAGGSGAETGGQKK